MKSKGQLGHGRFGRINSSRAKWTDRTVNYWPDIMNSQRVSSCKDAETQVVALILFLGGHGTGAIDALAKERRNNSV